MNGKVILRWVLVQLSVSFGLALIYHLVGHDWGYVAAAGLASYMVADHFEPRPWFGKLMDEWKCPRCKLHTKSTNPAWVAQIRNNHICREAR